MKSKNDFVLPSARRASSESQGLRGLVLRHHDSMAVALKRSPVFRHSISVGARRGDDVRADNLYADSSASKKELAQLTGPEGLRVR
jgi:hypothetical protein